MSFAFRGREGIEKGATPTRVSELLSLLSSRNVTPCPPWTAHRRRLLRKNARPHAVSLAPNLCLHGDASSKHTFADVVTHTPQKRPTSFQDQVGKCAVTERSERLSCAPDDCHRDCPEGPYLHVCIPQDRQHTHRERERDVDRLKLGG